MNEEDSGLIFKEVLDRLDAIERRLDKIEKKKPVARTEGSDVWNAYVIAFEMKFGIKPIPNAKNYGMARSIAARVGKEIAIDLVYFYMGQRDAWYQRSNYTLGPLLKDCETLVTRMRTGIKVTQKQAQTVEEGESNASVAMAYFDKKHDPKEQS